MAFMPFLYLSLNIFIVSIPLGLTFDPRVRFYRKWPAVAASVVLVGGVFLFWDILATHFGDWGFHPAYCLRWRVFGLPLEELLFFVTVPYSCLFIYEVVCYYHEEKIFRVRPAVLFGVVAVLLVLAILCRDRIYTFVVLSSSALTVLLTLIIQPDLLFSRRYALFMGWSFLPFIIFNGILTAVPVVMYHQEAILGIRILSIPVEDVLYCFCLLTLSLMVYRKAQG